MRIEVTNSFTRAVVRLNIRKTEEYKGRLYMPLSRGQLRKLESRCGSQASQWFVCRDYPITTWWDVAMRLVGRTDKGYEIWALAVK